MIDLAMFGGEFYYPQYKKVASLKPILTTIHDGFLNLNKVKKTEIIDLFQDYSENLRKNRKVNRLEGAIFLSAWLRKSNFVQIVEKNFNHLKYLEDFIGDKKRIKAQPRGIACHWIAGNVPTLGMFSLLQSLFVGNANILRIPLNSHDTIIKLLKVFSSIFIFSSMFNLKLFLSSRCGSDNKDKGGI